MPTDFDTCVKKGGRVRTIDVNDHQYMHVCILDGTTHKGEIMNKQQANASIPAELATAAAKVSKFEVVTDGTREGTKILLNGKEIPNLGSFNFSFWPQYTDQPVNVSFSTVSKGKAAGDLEAYTSFRLIGPSEGARLAVNAERANATLEWSEGLAPELKPPTISNRYARIGIPPRW